MSNRESLKNLRDLCDALSDRDIKLKSDHQMYVEFFSNFPVPVTIWSIGNDHRVISRYGNGFICDNGETVDDMFTCETLKDLLLEKHELALEGCVQSFFIHQEDKIYWTRLVPRKNSLGKAISVTGMAWDVTTNALMLHCFEEVLNCIASDDIEGAKLSAQRGLDSSRLKKMLDAEGK